MKKTVLIIFSIVIVVFSLDKLFEFLYTYNHNVKLSFVRAKPRNAQVVVLGSSNALYMFDSKSFAEETGMSSYNLAENHTSIAENLLTLKLYLEKNSKPELVLLSLTLPDLALSGWAFHSYRFSAYSHNPEVQKYFKSYDPQYYTYSKLPLFRFSYYNEFVNPLLFQGLLQVRQGQNAYYSTGTYRVPNDPKGFDGFFAYVAKHKSTKLAFPDSIKNQLLDFTELCSREKIKLVVYEPPYWAGANPFYVNVEETEKEVAAFLHSKGVHYLTFGNSLLRGDKKNFVSVFHLNGKASILFTKELAGKTRNLRNPH